MGAARPPRRESVRVQLRARPPDRGQGGRRGADHLGADPVGGGDPCGSAAPAGPLGRRADRAGLRHRGGDHAWAGNDRDDLRRRVLLARDRRNAGVRGLRSAFPRARGPDQARPGRRGRPARRPGGQLRVPARALGRDPVRLRGGAAPSPAPRRGLRSRGRDRSSTGAGVQSLGAGLAASLRLLVRGLRPGILGARPVGTELGWLLRDRPAAPGCGDRPVACRPRALDADAGAGDGRRRRDHDAQARSPG